MSSRTARLELDPNDDELMDRFNDKLLELQKQFGLGQDEISLTYEQAAEALGRELLTIIDYAGRGILRRGERPKTVHVDDVVQRLLAPRTRGRRKPR